MKLSKPHAGRFVVLFHKVFTQSSDENRSSIIRAQDLQQRGSHWDLMLEHNGILETWALDGPPAAQTTRVAQKLPPHRMEYLTYEGPVSGDRGVVTRIISGNYDGELPFQEADEPFSLNLCWEGQQMAVHFVKQDLNQWQIWFGSFSVVV